MLLTKALEIQLSPKNIKYYKSLGYVIPTEKDKKGRISVPRGTKIKVNIKDFPKNSHYKVIVKCDRCENINETNYQNYNRTIQKHNGLFLCNSCSNIGRKCLEETKQKIGNANRGEKSSNWNPNLTKEERNFSWRNNSEYLNWKKCIWKRDNYICQCCNHKFNYKDLKDINAHHLNGGNWCKEQRYEVENGVTLCKTCHSSFHSIYGKGNNTKEQFEEWIGHAIELVKFEGELPTARKVKDLTTGEIYNSAYECAEKIGVTYSQIYDICNKKIRIKNFKHKDGSIHTYESKIISARGHKLMWSN